MNKKYKKSRKNDIIVAKTLETEKGKIMLLNAMAKSASKLLKEQYQKCVDDGYYDLPINWWKYESPWDAFVADFKERMLGHE